MVGRIAKYFQHDAQRGNIHGDSRVSVQCELGKHSRELGDHPRNAGRGVFFLPFYRRLNVTTICEYLELRFSPAIRIYGSLSFVVLQLAKMGVFLLLPELALSTVTGFNVYLCILVMGLLCTVYTVMGGIEAVIRTDVLQSCVLLGGGLLLCLPKTDPLLFSGIKRLSSRGGVTPNGQKSRPSVDFRSSRGPNAGLFFREGGSSYSLTRCV